MNLKLLEINLSNIGAIVGLVVAIGGFLGWLLMRFLDDKKDKTIYRMEIDQIKRDVANVFKRLDTGDDEREKLNEKCHAIELKLGNNNRNPQN